MKIEKGTKKEKKRIKKSVRPDFFRKGNGGKKKEKYEGFPRPGGDFNKTCKNKREKTRLINPRTGTREITERKLAKITAFSLTSTGSS
jgi:hypothetical protein